MFLLKKIIGILFLPLPFSMLGVLIGLFLLWFTSKQKIGKILVSIGVIFILFFSYKPTAELLLRPLEDRYPFYPDSIVKSEPGCPPGMVVVLGGGHLADRNLPQTSRLSRASLIRLVEGISIYRQIPGARLLVSGGGVFDSVSDAEVMAQMAEMLGVDKNDIVVESQSVDTETQAENIRVVIGKERFILVTSASHMPRAAALFKKAGMNPIPAPTEYLTRNIIARDPVKFFPTAGNLEESERAIHEILGLVWAKLKG